MLFEYTITIISKGDLHAVQKSGTVHYDRAYHRATSALFLSHPARYLFSTALQYGRYHYCGQLCRHQHRARRGRRRDGTAGQSLCRFLHRPLFGLRCHYLAVLRGERPKCRFEECTHGSGLFAALRCCDHGARPFADRFFAPRDVAPGGNYAGSDCLSAHFLPRHDPEPLLQHGGRRASRNRRLQASALLFDTQLFM